MRRGAGLVGAAILLHLVLYGIAIPFSFSWDDRKIILDAGKVSGKDPLLTAFARGYDAIGFHEGVRQIAYRPVTVVSLGVSVRLFGLAPAPLRFTNVVLAGVGVGLFGLLVVSLGAPPFVAWLSVVLLSCHPVRMEPVVSIVGRSELLMALLVVAALLARRRPLLSGGLLLAALLSKENAFAAPALLLLVLFCEPRGKEEPSSLRERGRKLLPLFAAWGAAFAIAVSLRVAALGSFLTGSSARISPADNLLAALPFGERIEGALSLIPLAFGRLFWPTVLSPDYSRTTFLIDELLAPSAIRLGAFVLLLSIVGSLAILFDGRLRRCALLAGFGLAWTLASYLPFANFLFAMGIAFTERTLYLPAAGVAVAAASLLGEVRGFALERKRIAIAVTLLAVLLALLGAGQIFRLLPDWENDRTLMEAIARDLPRNSKAHWNLALLSLGEGKSEEAAGHLATAITLDPNSRAKVAELVRHAKEIGRPDQAALLEGFLFSTEREVSRR